MLRQINNHLPTFSKFLNINTKKGLNIFQIYKFGNILNKKVDIKIPIPE